MNPNTQKLLRQLDQRMQSGYDKLLRPGPKNIKAGMDQWLSAWALVKELIDQTDAEIRTPDQFDELYPDGLQQSVGNWYGDLEMELGNAGYHERCIVYVHEILTYFPDLNDDALVTLRRAEADAHWALGRQTEAEAIFSALVEQFPNKGWAYIGWSDRYYDDDDSAKEYEKGAEILLRALEQPDLEDRLDVLDRLVELYEEADYPEEAKKEHLIDLNLLLKEQQESLEKENKQLQRQIQQWRQEHQQLLSDMQEPPSKLGRNDPCWCGSGKKYKHCHLKSDQG